MKQQHIGIGVCGSDGVLAMLSPALEESLGVAYSPTTDSAWVGQYSLCDEAGQPLPPGGDPLARAHRGEHVTGQLVTVRRPGRDRRWLLCSAFPVHGGNAEEVGAAVLTVDVTVRVTEQLRLDTFRDLLIQTVNHEFRTPLAAITGHLELIEDATPGLPAPVQWSINAIGRSAHRLGEVVTSISDLAETFRSPRDGAD